MANVLPIKVRARIVGALVEGNSIRSTARLTKTDKNAVIRLGLLVGEGARRLHDKLVRHVPGGTIEIDETWGYVGRHERRKTKKDPAWFGDQYTMFALEADTKMIPSYVTGKRTLDTATAFLQDLRDRVDGKPQITFDGWDHWIEATRRTFGHRGADVGRTVKEYQKACRPDDTSRGCGRVKSQTKSVVYGKPDWDRISTSLAERFNLTSRMHDRRLTRLTNAYSKRVENLAASAALHYFWYNFVRVHESLGTTPAVKAGLADHVWTVAEMTKAALAEVGAEHPEPKNPRRFARKTHVEDADPTPGAPPSPAAAGAPRRTRAAAPSVDGADEEEEAPAMRRDRSGERGHATLGALSSVGLAALGVVAAPRIDDAIKVAPFGRAVPASGVAVATTIAGAMLARHMNRPGTARAAASLAVGLAVGMTGRAMLRRSSPPPLAGGSAEPLSGAERAPWWRRALAWNLCA